MIRVIPKLSGARVARFGATIGATLLFGALSANAYDLYWSTENKQIMASNFGGTEAVEIFNGATSSPAMASHIVDIAVTDTHIYWTGHSGRDIWRADRDGANPTRIIAEAGANIHGLAVSETSGKIYFADFEQGLFSADIGGGSVAGLVSGAFTDVTLDGSATSGPDELLAVGTADDWLWRATPEYSSYYTEVQLPGETDNYGVVIHPETRTVYYTSFGGNAVYYFSLRTQDSGVLATPGISQPLDIELSPSGTHLLIAERGRGISAYQLDTGNYGLIAEAADAYFGVAVAADPGEIPPPPPPPVGTVLWSTDFEDDAVEGLPSLGWAEVVAPTTGNAKVILDADNVFGFGTDNRFVRADQVVSFSLRSDLFSVPAEVITFSFDFIGHFKPNDGRWLQAAIRANLPGTWAHITSILMSSETIRQAPNSPSYGSNGLPIRMETIYNNSTETITYEDPAGNLREIRSKEAALWVYHHTTGMWEMLVDSYVYNRSISETGAVLDHISIFADGNTATRTFDLDNVEVRMGASFSDLEGEVYEPPPIPVAEDGEIFWTTDFENDTPGALPSVGWGGVSTPGSGVGTVRVETDSENVFGFGTDNQFLRIDGGFNFNMTSATFWTPAEVLTLSFDYIGRFEPGDGRWVNVFLRAGTARTHITSLSMSSATIRQAPGSPSYGGNDIPVRIETIMNNSDETIHYPGPDGTVHQLESAQASVWAYHHTTGLWQQLARSYNYERSGAGTGQLMDNIHFLLDGSASSGVPRHFDLDNITVTNGAHLSDLEGGMFVPPFAGHLEADFEGIPQGEITSAGADSFLHGNISGWVFHGNYDNGETPPLLIVADTENRFGEGIENQVLRGNGARGWTMRAANNFNQEVMTLRIDMTGEQASAGRLTTRFFNGFGEMVSRLEIFATGDTGTVDAGTEASRGAWDYGVVNRFEAVVNNSSAPITYTTPSGGSKTLISTGTDLWVNGKLTFADATDGHAGAPGPIARLDVNTFSTNLWQGDIARVQTYDGVELVEVEAEEGSFANWIAMHFAGETDPAIIGAEADPDGDGIPNLLEFALGLDPKGTGRSGLPAVGTELIEVDGTSSVYLTLSYTKPDSVSGVGYAVHVTSDLTDWNDEAVFVESVSNGDGTTTFVYRDVVPLDGANRRFLHLDVSVE